MPRSAAKSKSPPKPVPDIREVLLETFAANGAMNQLLLEHLERPAPLDPFRCTIRQARAAHRQSASKCLAMLKDALSDPASRRVTKFSRGSWSQDWPAGATMFCYMFAHDAHHRGQIILLARELGYRLPIPAAYGIWHWEKLWKQCGFTTRPR